jgi:hypothetical protein
VIEARFALDVRVENAKIPKYCPAEKEPGPVAKGSIFIEEILDQSEVLPALLVESESDELSAVLDPYCIEKDALAFVELAADE